MTDKTVEVGDNIYDQYNGHGLVVELLDEEFDTTEKNGSHIVIEWSTGGFSCFPKEMLAPHVEN